MGTKLIGKMKELDALFMNEALIQAQMAFNCNEVPIGAIVIDENFEIIGKGFNQIEQHKNQLFHAEILAIEMACKQKKDWRLNNCTIFVTLEPCLMCFGLIRQSRIKRLVYAAKSPQFGYQNYLQAEKTPPNEPSISFGLKEDDSLAIMRLFFQKAREPEKIKNEEKF